MSLFSRKKNKDCKPCGVQITPYGYIFPDIIDTPPRVKLSKETIKNAKINYKKVRKPKKTA